MRRDDIAQDGAASRLQISVECLLCSIARYLLLNKQALKAISTIMEDSEINNMVFDP